MTAEVAGGRSFPELSGGGQRLPKVRTPHVRHGRIFGIRIGQLVSTQLAAAVLLHRRRQRPDSAGRRGVFTAIVLLAITWLRLRGRWAFEWLGTALRYTSRRHASRSTARRPHCSNSSHPGARVEQADLAGDPAAIIVDGQGLTAVLELGDPAGVLAEEPGAVPPLAGLLPPAGTEHPPCRIQLVLTGAPAPSLRAGGGIPANSYRQLTEGRLLGHSRAFLAVRVLHAEGWSEEDLRLALSGLVRKLLRRLSPTPARPLGEAAALRVIAELAHDDGLGAAQESWPGLRIGGQTQATFRLRRWPDLRIETSQRLVPGCSRCPRRRRRSPWAPAHARSSAQTSRSTSPSAWRRPTRPPCRSPPRRSASCSPASGATARRLDGEHLDGLTATLPLAMTAHPGLPGTTAPDAPSAKMLDDLELPVGNSGLMIGRNRQGDPVIACLFRPEQTRAVLIGGVRCAQLLALRAMAIGARVVVQTARPHAWEPFIRGAAVPGESISVLPPGRAVEIPPGSALHPLLVVVDIGPVGADNRPGAGWQATLVVRDDFSRADADAASRADLLLVQPLRPEEAALVGSTLGLGETADWLTQIRADMVGIINRRAVRWAALSQTSIEAQLIGPPVR